MVGRKTREEMIGGVICMSHTVYYLLQTIKHHLYTKAIYTSTQSFTMSPSRWIKETNAKGMISKRGKYGGGTFAHPDIALEFASWIDPAFKLYLIREFERLNKNFFVCE